MKAFRQTKSTHIDELNADLVELIHEPTGARVLHLQNEDPENVFCLSFSTRPSSSNGVAHILEHTVLCGSEKFPIKDPFFAMTRRSLHTFMNAFTGPDFTCYPAASQNKKDFYNLLSVYLDAVFYPKLDKKSFLQEGHRLELEGKELVRKGIVYNEMKGAMASMQARLNEEIGKALFPDLTYHYNSGGDPKEIPQLTHEELLQFHREYYHPSRALFYFYGNFPLEDHLQAIEEQVLRNTAPLPQLEAMPHQRRFTEPRRVRTPYPASPQTGQKCCLTFGFLTCDSKEQEKLLALLALDSALMDTDASPLRKRILETGLCAQVGSSIDEEMCQVPWLFTMTGCEEVNGDALEKVLFSSLREIAQEGIDPELILAALHQLEMEKTEITRAGYPFGLSLYFRSALLAQHGNDPLRGLTIHRHFTTLREKLADREYVRTLLHDYFIDNPHWVRVLLYPDGELMAKEEQEEKEELEKRGAALSEIEQKSIQQEQEELQSFQSEQERASLDCLPKVSIQDVTRKPREFPLKGRGGVFCHAAPTNGFVYLDAAFPLLHCEEASALSLATNFLGQIGTATEDWTQRLPLIQRYTGGIGASLYTGNRVEGETPAPYLLLSAKALARHTPNCVALLQELIAAPNFLDKKRIRDLITKVHTGLENSLVQRAMGYATSLASLHIQGSSTLNYYWNSIGLLEYVRALIKEGAEDAPERMQALITAIFQQRSNFIIGCEEEIEEELTSSLQPLTSGSCKEKTLILPQPPKVPQARIVASPVAFTAWALPAPRYGDPLSPALSAACHIMQKKRLHPKVREEGGAYGSGARYRAVEGVLTLFSYRDPHLSRTLEQFQHAIEDLAAGKFTTEDLEESQLEVIQNLDQPVAPGARAGTEWAWRQAGLSYALRKSRREKLLDLTKEEVVEVATRHLLPHLSSPHLAVCAEEKFFAREQPKLADRGMELTVAPL